MNLALMRGEEFTNPSNDLKVEMETEILLRDQKVFPDADVLKNSLKDAYLAFEQLMKITTAPEYGLVPEWNYYKDGKAWLCKGRYKKKTVFWLSVWDQFFKITFYFTKTTSSGVTELNVNKSLKEKLINSKSIGKLIPLIIDVKKREQLKDVLKLIDYKRSLK